MTDTDKELLELAALRKQVPQDGYVVVPKSELATVRKNLDTLLEMIAAAEGEKHD